MRRTFVKNLLLLQGLNLVIKPVWLLLIDKEAQNLLGSAYAEYYIIFNLAVVLNIILDIGIQNFSNTGVASDEQFFKVNFKRIVAVKLLLSSLYLVVIFGTGAAMGVAGKLLAIVSVNQILTSLVLYLRTNINGLHHYAIDSLLSVSDKFFAILFCLALYWSNQIGIIGFALAQLVATSVSFIIALYLNLRYWSKIEFNNTIQPFSIKDLFIKSIPFALLFALMGLYTRMDVLMMKALLPDAIFHCGIYAQSFRLLDAAAMFAMLFSGLLLPMFTRLLSTNEDVRPLASLASSLLLQISLTVAVVALLFGEDILAALYNYKDISHLRLSAQVFGNILSAFIPMSLTFVFSTLLTAKRDLKYLNIFAFIALTCNLLLNFILIPKWGSFGASISSMATQSVFAALCIWRCIKLFHFKLDGVLVSKYLAYTVMLFGLSYLTGAIHNTFFNLFAFSIGALVLVFALKLLDIRQILNTFKFKGNKI